MELTRLKIDEPAIRAALQKRGQLRFWLALGQIAGGLVATVLIPAVAASLCLIGFNRAHMWSSQPSGLNWWEGFELCFLVVMPIAYFLEWRTQGGFLIRKLREIESSDGGWYEAITRDRTWRWNAREGAAQWETYLFAPRMVFAGFAKLRGIRLVAVADTGRAAEILAVLVGQDHGVALDRLRRSHETALAFGQVMSYLLFYDWVGASEDGQKAWALTETREELHMGMANRN